MWWGQAAHWGQPRNIFNTFIHFCLALLYQYQIFKPGRGGVQACNRKASRERWCLLRKGWSLGWKSFLGPAYVFCLLSWCDSWGEPRFPLIFLQWCHPWMSCQQALAAGCHGGVRQCFRAWVECAMFWLLLSIVPLLRRGCCHLGGLFNEHCSLRGKRSGNISAYEWPRHL